MQYTSVNLGGLWDPSEIYSDMFFQLHRMFWGGLDQFNVDFGSGKVFTFGSENIVPSKIRFVAPSGGHDHTLNGAKLHYDALRKGNLDLNALHVLWATYFNDFSDPNTKFVILGVLIAHDMVTNPSGAAYTGNDTRYVQLPTKPSTTVSMSGNNLAEFDLVRTSEWESDYWDQYETGMKLVGVFLQGMEEHTTVPSAPRSYFARGETTLYAGQLSGQEVYDPSNAKIWAHGLLVLRYSAPPEA